MSRVKEIVEQIVIYANSQGINQRELATKSGVGETAIPRLKKGDDANFKTLEKMANAVGYELTLKRMVDVRSSCASTALLRSSKANFEEPEGLTVLDRVIYLCDARQVPEGKRKSYLEKICTHAVPTVDEWFESGGETISLSAQIQIADHFETTLDFLNGRSFSERDILSFLDMQNCKHLENFIFGIIKQSKQNRFQDELVYAIDSLSDKNKQLLLGTIKALKS